MTRTYTSTSYVIDTISSKKIENKTNNTFMIIHLHIMEITKKLIMLEILGEKNPGETNNQEIMDVIKYLNVIENIIMVFQDYRKSNQH